jgi:hypothetical protein
MTIPANVLQNPFVGVAGETKAFNVIAELIGCQGLELSENDPAERQAGNIRVGRRGFNAA